MYNISLLIVDDDAFWKENLSKDLKKFFNSVSVVSTKDEAIIKLRTIPIDIIIMDINLTLNYLDGIKAVKEISKFRKSKIIIFTSITEEKVVLEAFENGIINYISKKSYKDITQAVIDAFENRTSIHSDSANILRDEFVQNCKLKKLTPIEREVYDLSREGKNKTEIAFVLNKSFFTIKNQLKVIREKLKAD